ncbi:MAG: acetyl-CoA synthase subunit gamma [Deltaproteobacteria bacterium RBG_19FT_COMBO_43_11]|nr:MAG: acetyl-CoA synthase subunit gamma [Deltaproteobacteria bacterium RBG_19FT_COMBO_43_11]
MGSINTPSGKMPRVSPTLKWHDHWGSIKARWGAGRMDYAIDPGLYALGNPDANSPVLVTANYKMSFDRLREALPGRDVWILVLDTKGINVWCAAGKGTFGTDELIRKIEASGLKDIVSHRKLILPQLGAPGVAAHKVKQISGFKIYYGPIRAKDVAAYIDAGLKANAEMRVVTFPLKDRIVLIPIELIETIKPFLIIAPVLFLIGGIGGPEGFWANAFNYGLFAVLAFLSAILGGVVINPIFLPYLPGRAFSIKGFFIGIVIAFILFYLRNINLQTWPEKIEVLAWFLIIPSISAYLAMNFTGASTYTSLSGVKKELRRALPLEITASICGLLIWITSRLMTYLGV